MTSWRSVVRVNYIPPLRKNLNLSAIRRTAAEIAAAALFEMFPNVELWGGVETPTGFEVAFHFPHPIHPETLALIEERMRQIVKERRPIRTLEMVPFSAAELMKKMGHRARVEELAELEGLVEVIQMGPFHHLSEGPHLNNSGELSAFKLLSMDGERLVGCAHFSKEELKGYLKKLNSYQDPYQIGEGRGLWIQMEEGLVWKEKGLGLKRRLEQGFKKRLCPDAVEILGPSGLHNAIAKKMNRIPLQIVEEGAENLQISFYWPREKIEEALISSLQLVDEILKILGFSFQVYFAGRKKGMQRVMRVLEKLKWEAEEEAEVLGIDFRIKDEIERNWTVVQLREIKESGLEGFNLSISVEKILALLIEKNLDTSFNQASTGYELMVQH